MSLNTNILQSIAPKEFLALLNGVYKREFEKDPQITLEFIKQEIFPSKTQITIPVLQTLVDNCNLLIQEAAEHNYDLSQFETVLKEV